MTKPASPKTDLPHVMDVARQAGLVMTRKGSQYYAHCPNPDHPDEKAASLAIDPAKNCFKCFGCGVGGGVMAFLKFVGVNTTEVELHPNHAAAPARSRSSRVDAAAVWECLAQADRQGMLALNGRGLGDAAREDLVRFNTGKTGDDFVDGLARSGFRIALPCYAPDGTVVKIVLRNVERHAKRRFHVVGGEGAGFFGDPQFVEGSDAVLVVEGLADYLAGEVLAAHMEPRPAVIGVRSAHDFSERLIASLLADYKGEVFIYRQNDGAGHRFVSKAARILQRIGTKHYAPEPLLTEAGADLADAIERGGQPVELLADQLDAAMAKARTAGPPKVEEDDDLPAEAPEEDADPEPPKQRPPWQGGPCGPAYVAASMTALVSRALVEAAATEVGESTDRLREAQQRRGGGRQVKRRSAQSAALLALKLDTLLRVMSREKLAYPSVGFLRRRLGVGRRMLHRQQVYAAEQWLKRHNVSRTPRDPTLRGNYREWNIQRPQSLADAVEDYICVPAMAVLWLSPFTFFVLVCLHEVAELLKGGSANDARRALIPLEAYLNMPADSAAELIPAGKRRVLGAMQELEAWKLLCLKPLKLTPKAGLQSPFAALRAGLSDDTVIANRLPWWEQEDQHE